MQEALSVARFLNIDNVYTFLQFEKRIGHKSYTRTPPTNVAAELSALAKLKDLIRNQIEEYPTTVEEDRGLME